MNKRYVALGDLIADCYYNEKKLIRVDGGGSKFNVMANMAQLGYHSSIIGGRGCDIVGEMLVNNLIDMGVDTSNIYTLLHKTRSYNLLLIKEKLPQVSYICTRQSPMDNEPTWYENKPDDLKYMKNQISPEDVIILDEVDNFSRQIIKELKNDLVIDIGNITHLKNLSNEEILELKNKFEIIQLNERVALYLMERFNFSNLSDIYNILNPKLLVVTYGNKGAVYVYQNRIIAKELVKIEEEVDATGAGDAFLSSLTGFYYDCDKELNDSFIDEAFNQATILTSEVVKYYGARGHIHHNISKKQAKKKELKNDDN